LTWSNEESRVYRIKKNGGKNKIIILKRYEINRMRKRDGINRKHIWKIMNKIMGRRDEITELLEDMGKKQKEEIGEQNGDDKELWE
jgi:hypothetical protein